MSHFHTYLYGQDVTVYTDHAAVKAVLQNPATSGRHARWWIKVHGSGVKSVNIICRAGKDNVIADAFSQATRPRPWRRTGRDRDPGCQCEVSTGREGFRHIYIIAA